MAAGFDLPRLEEKILKFWKDRKIFEKTLENRAHSRRFVFFEGPPTANGMPGMHHFMGRVLKDLFVRYKTMRGYLVTRKAGWDTHGLPVEIEVEKELGLKNKKEIEKYGIAKFNAKAKKSVWKYKDEWEKFTERIGFWLDMDNPYITYDSKYIETLWWIIKQIDDAGLFYKGHKVLHWCPRCGTALSSHEVAQGYEKITENSVYLKFKVKGDNSFILSWTTTPWTLPGNVALAVNQSLKYVKIEAYSTAKGGVHPERSREGSQRASTLYGTRKFYILAEQRLEKVKELLEKNGYEVKADPTEVPMRQLLEMEYEPLFEIPALKSDKSYKVYPVDFVTADDGTGVVHTAVMYGEDDYNLGIKVGLPKIHTVDEAGNFIGVSKELDGKYVKSEEAERIILEHLKKDGNLLASERYEHDYPFCWRCKEPLLYYARDSWFVAMSKLRKQLLKNNEKINWIPEHLKHGRFGEFLNEVKDWAFSRERFWGTPLPVWQCDPPAGGCGNYKVVGSLEELEKYRYRAKNTYFLLRHGARAQSHDENGEPLIASQLALDKYDLTPEGVKQIEGVAEKIKEGGGLDLIFSSPFLRTKHTAEIVAKKLGLDVKIDDRLKEIDKGLTCEGKPRSACLPVDGKLAFDYRFNGGESWRDVRTRTFSVIKEIDEKHEGKKILLVGHGDPLWLLYSLTKNLSEEEAIARRAALYIERGELRQTDFKNYPYDETGETNIHRPYVDDIFLLCDKCRGKMTRVKEVADVWFDSGAMPFAQWHYPENEKIFKDNFPADFIAEGIDQTRGWFYTLLAISTLLKKGAPYKNVLSYSHVLDEKGKKMSKSLGNIVNPWNVIEKFGVDAARWYFCVVNNPADPKLFSIDDVGKKKQGFVMTLLNSLRFLELYDKPIRQAQGKPSTKEPKGEAKNALDKWILSRINNLARTVAGYLDVYDLNAASRALEGFAVEDLSNWWLRRSRERFQRPRSPADLSKSLDLFRHLLSELSKMLAPFTPFLAEHVYKKVNNRKESVHLEDWPKPKKKLINPALESQMRELRDFVTLGLAQRKANNIKVRQPLASVTLKKPEKFEPELENLILAELNVKSVAYDPAQEEELALDKKITSELLKESYAREVMRQIQDMRKEAKYKLDEKIYAAWASDNKEIAGAMDAFGKEIAENTLLVEFSRGHRPKTVFDVEKEFEFEPQIKIWLGVRNKK
ncbi:MAG: class I tRNA ligase family protein [Patescibacteria group bacterium]